MNEETIQQNLYGAARRFFDLFKNASEHAPAALELFRPPLESVPGPLLRVLQPIVAVVALTVLGHLLMMVLLNGGLVILALMLAALIVHRVFGIELHFASL